MHPPPTNRDVADLLRQGADLYEQQGDNPYRVNAYRRAADLVAGLRQDLARLLEQEGIQGLIKLPGIGSGIASAIQQIVRTGRWNQLDRLRGTLDPEQLFRSLPGVGPALARQIHDELELDTLEALEIAAHDGRLERVRGVGPRRAAAIRATLASVLARRRPRPLSDARPGIEDLLAVDAMYRQQAAAGRLPQIAPKRFNPNAEAWLPVLHTRRGDWHYTALYSNTERAHRLGRTHDWVVLYYYDDDHREGQCTVVTESRGKLAGQRVVRGREQELSLSA